MTKLKDKKLEKQYICPHCRGDIRLRNPKGFCDHLYYPENCEKCQEIELGKPTPQPTPKEKLIHKAVKRGFKEYRETFTLLGKDEAPKDKKEYCTKHSLFHGKKYKSCTPPKDLQKEEFSPPTEKQKYPNVMKIIHHQVNHAVDVAISMKGKKGFVYQCFDSEIIHEIDTLLLQQRKLIIEEIEEKGDWQENTDYGLVISHKDWNKLKLKIKSGK
jgi:hypothetical protein